MIYGPILKLRDKLTRKRHALTEDTEKPFLEHLEDLRNTLTRVVITLAVAIVICFVFHKYFFKIMEYPLDAAGLRDPKERDLPAALLELESAAQQPTWWRIHSTARGMADLDGPLKEHFLKSAAPDTFTRQFAHALLLYHAADALPEEARPDYIKSAAALIPGEDAAKITEYAAQLMEAKTTTSLEKPPPMVETEAFAPAETFMLSMKLSMFAGVIVSFPLLFYFLLEFILPGLTQRERKMIFPALSIGFALFLAGVLFAFFFVIPRALEFFHEYGAELGIKDRWRIGQFISFEVSFCLIFGLSFELPVVVMVMVKLGLLTCAVMRRSRAWAVLIIFIASAILTPTGDAFTMTLLAAPMVVMYEVCIWLAWFHERKQKRLEAEERLRDEARRASLIGVASVQAARPGDEPAPELPAPSDTSDSSDKSDKSDTSDSHPHHPDPADEYEQYLRPATDHHDHYHDHHSAVETHTESVPVEDRPEPVPSADEPPPEVTPPVTDTAAADDAPDSKTQSQP